MEIAMESVKCIAAHFINKLYCVLFISIRMQLVAVSGNSRTQVRLTNIHIFVCVCEIANLLYPAPASSFRKSLGNSFCVTNLQKQIKYLSHGTKI